MSVADDCNTGISLDFVRSVYNFNSNIDNITLGVGVAVKDRFTGSLISIL